MVPDSYFDVSHVALFEACHEKGAIVASQEVSRMTISGMAHISSHAG
jgi:hypothetical protein